jgi:hypothetical protein
MRQTLPTGRRPIVLAALAGFVALAALLAPAPAGAQTVKRITSASAVRVRSGPSTSAAVVDTLSIGVVLDELGRSDAPQRVGEQEDYWYRVGLPGGKQGWVFGGLTRAVDGAAVDQAYVDLARERLARDAEAYAFTDWTDLVAFLKRVSGTVRNRDLAGEIELSRLLATSKALLSIPYDKANQAPHTTWVAAQGDMLVYNEPAGQKILKAEVVWALYPKYADLPIGERIAWEAANVYLPGECEGDVACNLFDYTSTRGRYLELYPKGRYAEEALDRLIEIVRPIAEDATNGGENYTLVEGDPAWTEDMRKELAKAKSVAASASGPKRDEALRLIGQIEPALR